MIFNFESDFAGSLRCIPMVARQKLDLCGVKLSLRQWSRFSREDRESLTTLSAESAEERGSYRDLVLSLIAAKTDEPPKFLPSESFEGWTAPDRMPEAVIRQAGTDGVSPPTSAQWAALAPLQRFALIKLANSKHENENFVPAMREFGVLT
ncbi:hypothetical protein AA23498_0414 [Acetobacter nitrogenifigens DSM 23921 = NBRC 105050]|uniref:Nitrate reductase associated protein n=1 Tax=Acetobacter nitrogenifigens DSM 23921 = NBRC 105050 TaxID=1120919 RepID=A0A511XBU0_9PROT|nr:nitrate reductase associated protein [Acetobacter nitrogenifigens]GBQ88588.1 hypothetical protein AA23498_0414 [Acetobacter nitrogenifigens DSM 23921 = NBRC 105050]GEN60443.1 hypothetical protein ANI02nite_23270 [Acetobacter nitrogenifigens DSM 23921 = NBRC 105050]